MCGKLPGPRRQTDFKVCKSGDEADVAKQTNQAKDNQDNLDDDDALRALTRPSAAPDAPKKEEDDDDGGMLDLRALTMSGVPPAPAKEEAASGDDENKIDLKAAAAPAAELPAPTEAKPVAKVAEAAPVAAKAVVAEVAAAPTAVAPKSNTALFVGIAVAAAVGLGVYFAMKPPASSETVAMNEPSAPVPSEPARVEAPAAPAAPVVVENEAPTAPVAATPTEAAAPRAAERPAARGESVAHAPSPGAGAAPTREAAAPAANAATTPAAAAATEPANPNARAGNAPVAAEMNSLLDQALGGSPAAGGTRTTPTAAATAPAAATAAAAPAGPLPTTPSQSDVQRTLGRLLPGIRQCAGDQVGLASATILVRNDGTVASASIAGAPFGGTPQGACMEGVVRTAHFPPFRQTTLRVTYPFSIRAQ